MALSAIWLAKQLASGYELKPIPARGMAKLEASASRINRALDRRDYDSLALLLDRLGHRNKNAMILVESESKKFIYGFPHQMRPEKEPFMQLLNQSTAFSIKTGLGTFFGPLDLKIDGKKYKLFVGNSFKPGMFQQLRRRHPFTFIVFALVISGVLCAWMTWSLLKPIRQLQSATRRMSKGELSTRVLSVGERGDELGQLGKDFNNMSEKVEQSVQRQKRLLADISHELRSPLARLQVAIGIAQQYPERPVESNTQKQLTRIEKEAHQIETMLEQLLKLSRLEAMEKVTEKQECDLANMLSDLVSDADFEAQAQDKSVMFIARNQTIVCGDLPVLASAFDNVIRNAVKYCSTKVEVRMCVDKGMITVEVSDDGSGVPVKELNDIFVPFYRLSASRNRNSGGVGLGLAIAHQAILSHHGTISASNNSNGGLTVKIQIPLA